MDRDAESTELIVCQILDQHLVCIKWSIRSTHGPLEILRNELIIRTKNVPTTCLREGWLNRQFISNLQLPNLT